MPVLNWVVARAVAATALLSAALLRAEPAPTPLELRWEAPADCPRAAAFEAAVNRLVGSAPASRVRAHVLIARGDDGNYTLTLTTELNAIVGERTLQGRSCQLVVDAAVVTVALILNPDVEVPIDGDLQMPVTSRATPGNSEPERPATPHYVDTLRSPTTSRKASSIRWLGASAVGFELGVLPRPTPDVSLGVGVEHTKYLGIIWASYAPPQNVFIASNSGGRLWNVTLKMTGCWSSAPVAPSLGLCAAGVWTRIQGTGLGVPNHRRGVTNWVAPGAGAFVDVPLNQRAAFQVASFALVPIVRPDTHLDGVGTVQRPAILTAVVQAGVIVSFN